MISCQGPNSLNSLQFLLVPFCGRILGCLYNGHRHYSHHCDPVYNTLRDENPMGVNRYKSELLTDFIIQRQTVSFLEKSYRGGGVGPLYLLLVESMADYFMSLSYVLECLTAEDTLGFSSLDKQHSQEPEYDLADDTNYQVRLFRCKTYCELNKKWCYGEGAYNVASVPPPNALCYSNHRVLNRVRAYNDLFALCALEISSGYWPLSGLSFLKIEGIMYYQVYSMCSMHIEDGKERKYIIIGRSLNTDIIDAISHSNSSNPYIREFR
ncbi:hypothetical protein J6590_065774 [Homalodisca vitripennis]|nr:hypothetical protein J6590_065774 [Homalodisca vitripennis]